MQGEDNVNEVGSVPVASKKRNIARWPSIVIAVNPRFGKMFEPVTRGSVERLANAVQHAGYREDPLYRMRIMATAQDPLMKRALWQYDRWPPG